jgi:hypothetical protein
MMSLSYYSAFQTDKLLNVVTLRKFEIINTVSSSNISLTVNADGEFDDDIANGYGGSSGKTTTTKARLILGIKYNGFEQIQLLQGKRA